MTTATQLQILPLHTERMTLDEYRALRNKKMDLEQVYAHMIGRKMNGEAIRFVQREIKRLNDRCNAYIELEVKRMERREVGG